MNTNNMDAAKTTITSQQKGRKIDIRSLRGASVFQNRKSVGRPKLMRSYMTAQKKPDAILRSHTGHPIEQCVEFPKPECPPDRKDPFPLPPVEPCCPKEPKCEPPAPECPTPPFVHLCPPPKGKVEQLQLIDPCDPSQQCKWTIKQDEAGSGALVFQSGDQDVALLDCQGNLNLLGALDAAKLCLPVNAQNQQWCLRNGDNGELIFECTNVESGDTLNSVVFDKNQPGGVQQNVLEIDFCDFDDTFAPQSADELPDTLILTNSAPETNNSVWLPSGSFNGQCIVIVNTTDNDVFVNQNQELAAGAVRKFYYVQSSDAWF